MKSIGDINRELRQYSKQDGKLLFFCICLSQCLMSAYAIIMWSPTVLKILPEGGDSRKQVIAIFACTCIGCIVFVSYAAMLFFKQRSRQTGILMALGITRKNLRHQIFSEIGSSGIKACGLGIISGTVVAMGIWQGFSMWIVDTQEMKFYLAPQSLIVGGVFAVVTNLILLIQGMRFERQTNIMDVLNTERKNEPIREVKRWYGWVGIILIIVGFLLGYLTPSFCIFVLKWYPPEGLGLIFYSPLFVGIHMVTYYTVVHGWRRDKNYYKDIITKSMMKFYGMQTVRNMLIVIILVIGGYFAAFYIPLMGSGALYDIESREVDYLFHYRKDQQMLSQQEIKELADAYDVKIEDYNSLEFINLAHDGEEEIDDENGKYHKEYRELLGEDDFLSESNYEAFTGDTIDIPSGYYMSILCSDGSGNRLTDKSITKLTNPNTNKQININHGGSLVSDILATQYYVLNDEDYKKISDGLEDSWRENLVSFNVERVEDTYDFAKHLYKEIINHSDASCEIPSYYDRISKSECEKRGEKYWADEEGIHYEEYETSEFKQYWRYQPQFRIMDKKELLTTYAVFFMVFLFITIICYVAMLIIIYTRNITLAMNNKQVYEDLRRLGAGYNYLYKCIKSQVGKVFKAPVIIGTLLISTLYVTIIYMNDGGFFSKGELIGLMSCGGVELIMTAGIYLFYHYNLRKVCELLEIRKPKMKRETYCIGKMFKIGVK